MDQSLKLKYFGKKCWQNIKDFFLLTAGIAFFYLNLFLLLTVGLQKKNYDFWYWDAKYMFTQIKCVMWDGGTLSLNLLIWKMVYARVQYPRLYCVYINDLIVQLRSLRVGCQLNCAYLGIWVCADDILLLSPSQSWLYS